MGSDMKKIALLALMTGAASLAKADTGVTTRYWDCCKPSCAWNDKADVSAPVTTCDIDHNPLTDYDVQSGCTGGTAYMCSNQSPWAVNDSLSYGFAAVNIAGGSESTWCCACYKLTFTSGAVSGKTMIVQATNTGADLGSNQFDIAMPGGGVGIYNGCTAEWGAPSSGWGAQYGGISSRSECDSFPEALQDGCYWRFDWFENADNPNVEFEQVTCPKALTDITGCVRSGETPTGSSDTTTASSTEASSSVVSVASSVQSSASSYTSSTASPVVSTTASSVVYSTPATSTYEVPTTTSVSSVVEEPTSTALEGTGTFPQYPSQSGPGASSETDGFCEIVYVYE